MLRHVPVALVLQFMRVVQGQWFIALVVLVVASSSPPSVAPPNAGGLGPVWTLVGEDAQDLMYLQHLVFSVRPAVIVETGTYKGGLTFFFSTLMDALGLDGRILSIDKNSPDRVHDASWFCPVCESCIRVWETEAWNRHVEFYQGWADDRELYRSVRMRVGELSGPVLVNLDACHEHDCVYVEILLYAPLVTLGSYLVVQDVKLDRLWGKPAVHAAVAKFLKSSPDFLRDRSMEFYGYTQHVYLRRVAKTLPEVHLEDSLDAPQGV